MFSRERSSCLVQMADFQNKLSELEKSQSELVTENASLKDLCLYLNEQREQSVPAYMTGAAISRDSGDGSSGSSQSVDKLVSAVHESEISPSLNDALQKPQQSVKGVFEIIIFTTFLSPTWSHGS